MKTRIANNWSFLIILFIISGFELWGTPKIPFHPDESTQLFMSADFELLFSQPLSMTWPPVESGDLRAHYRSLDAPITRYLLGLGRRLAGYQALAVDWDWSKSWQENQLDGALPDPGLLTAGRVTITLLLSLSICLIYSIGKTIGGQATGLLSAILLGINALVLLHCRRSMAEGALVTGLLLAVWCFLRGDKYPWLAGFGMALAFGSKQSTVALLPVGWLAVCWQPVSYILANIPLRFANSKIKGYPKSSFEQTALSEADHLAKQDQTAVYKIPKKPSRILLQIFTASLNYFGIFILLTLALNPFFWRHPYDAAKVAWENRQDLLNRQVANTARLAPGQVLNTTSERSMALLANLYFTPLSFWEVGNYQRQTADSEQIYLETNIHDLFRGTIGGGIFLALTLFGMTSALFASSRLTGNRKKSILLVFLASLFQAAALLLTIPLPWQRYVMPLVPLSVIWCAFAIGYPLHNRIFRQIIAT